MSDAILPLKRYFQISGRSSRREVWLWTLLWLVVGAACMVADFALVYSGLNKNGSATGSATAVFLGTPLTTLWLIVSFVPNWTVMIRRLHDFDRSAWWILIAFVPFIGAFFQFGVACTRGTRGPNRFGLDPKA